MMIYSVLVIIFIYFIGSAKSVNLEQIFKNIDENYSKLFNLPLDENEISDRNLEAFQMDQNLKLQLEAAIFYSNAKEMVNLRQDGKPKKIREQNANTLKVLVENFAASSTVSLVNLCHLWKLWRTLGDTLVENPKIPKNVKNYLKNRDQIDLNGVECDESIGRNRVFVRDTALANFSAIIALLQLQNGKRTIKFGIDEEFRMIDLPNFFNDKRAEKESNFAFQIRSMDKNKLMIRMKDKLRELIGPFFMTKLELIRPIEMNFDIVGDNELAMDYAKFLSQEHLVEEKAVTKISVRIIFGRIMQIFARIYAIWETPKIKILKKTILNLWNGKELQTIHTDLKMPGLKAVTKYFEFYLKLLRIFNSSQGIGEQEEQIGVVADPNIRQIYMEFAAKNKMFEMTWVALLEDHAKNILRLTESTTPNAFTALLKDSLMKEKGTKAKLNGFFTNNTEKGDEIYEALAKKYPKLKQLIAREELSDDQIRDLQIRNYIRFLNVTSSRNESMKSRFKLNLLLYYQWVKQMRDGQSSAEGKKEFDAKMGQIEITMDLVADENMAIEAYLVTVEANIIQEIEQFKQNKFLVNNGTPIKRHKEKVDEITEGSPRFREALKDIFVHETRMLKFGIDNPKVLERIKNKTEDTKKITGKSDEQNCTTKQREEAEMVTTTEEEEKAQMETLRDQYVQMMKEKDPIIMMHLKDSVMKNAAYFQCKQWLKLILQTAQEKPNKTNAKFKWVGQRTEFILADVQQKEKLMAHGQFKAEKICEMAHLITHIHSQLNSAAKWKEIADRNGITAFVEQLNLIAITAETEMDKPKCDDQWVIKQMLNNLGTSPTQEEIHMRIMAHLIETNVPFFDFMHQSATNLPHSFLSEYGSINAKELNIFYKNYLLKQSKIVGSWEIKMIMKLLFKQSAEVEQKMHQTKKNEVQWQLKNEFSKGQINEFYGPQMLKKAQKMSAPELIGQIVEHAQIFSKYTAAVCQKAAEPYAKIANAKAELFAMLKLLQIFEISSEIFRFICPLLRYVQFLNNEKTAQIWHTPYECFSAKFGPIFDEQLSLLADEHFIFLAEYLLKCDESDEIVHILREKDGALLAMNDLVGGHVKMIQIWAMPSVRQKLINKNYFNEMRLLDHYAQFFGLDSPPIDPSKTLQRLAADIFVWYNRMESKPRSIGGANGQQFADFLYFYCRIFNDSLSTEIAREASFMFSSFVDETFKFVEKMEKKKLDDPNFEIALAEMIHSVREKGKLGWIESGDKFNEPIEAIKAMHFAELNKFLTNKKKQKNLYGKFAAILADVAKNKGNQQNLLQILTMNDAKTFLEMANINFAKDPNFDMSLIEVKKEEKAAKYRRKKEKNKLKKQMLMNNNNNDNNKTNDRNNENESGEENEEISQNPSENETILPTIVAGFNDDNGTKCEESNGNDEEIENDELSVEHNSAEKISINISALNEFRNETFLHEKYEEYFENENDANETKFLLDAGIFVFELQKRLKMVDELRKLSYFDNLNLIKNIEKENAQFLLYCMQIEEFDQNEFFQKTYKILKIYSKNLEKDKNEEIPSEKQLKQIKRQMHQNNLSNLIVTDKQFGEKWKKYDEEWKNKKFIVLFGVKTFELKRFEKIKMRWKKLKQQITLDTDLYEQFLNKNEQNNYLSANFSEISQQIHFHHSDSAYDSNEIEKLLNEKRSDGLNLSQFDKRITTALSKINALIDKWSNGHARVGISGSLLLGTHTADSDVDLICIVPGQTMGVENFFGNKNAICEKNKCSDGTNDSLYCKLCENKSVAKLLKLMHSSIFLIKFHMDNVEIDITFVAIPGKSVLQAELNEQMLTDYMNCLTNEKEEHRKMLRTISSYRSTLYIATLFLEKRIFNSKLTDFLKPGKVNCQNDNKNLENLRYLILSIKLWAKNNFIYANRYGYLNGIMTSIMATKIVLLYQNASFNFLLEKFFLFYSLRPQKVPLQLEKMLADSKFDQFTATKRNESPLSILTPLFPAQNAAQLVTTAGARIIHEQVKNELIKIKRMGTEAYNFEELLKDSLPFIEKFDDFILINCFSASESVGEKFCRFVEGRLRLQIAYDIEIYGTKTQLLNKIYTETCSTIGKFITSSFRATYCNVWLIGINLRNENANDLNYALNLFDYRIKRDYLRYNYAKVSADGSAEKPYKAMEAEEIEGKMEQLKVGLKSIVTNREGLTE